MARFRDESLQSAIQIHVYFTLLYVRLRDYEIDVEQPHTHAHTRAHTLTSLMPILQLLMK